jgi:hypothetical protein
MLELGQIIEIQPVKGGEWFQGVVSFIGDEVEVIYLRDGKKLYFNFYHSGYEHDRQVKA